MYGHIGFHRKKNTESTPDSIGWDVGTVSLTIPSGFLTKFTGTHLYS